MAKKMMSMITMSTVRKMVPIEMGAKQWMRKWMAIDCDIIPTENAHGNFRRTMAKVKSSSSDTKPCEQCNKFYADTKEPRPSRDNSAIHSTVIW